MLTPGWHSSPHPHPAPHWQTIPASQTTIWQSPGTFLWRSNLLSELWEVSPYIPLISAEEQSTWYFNLARKINRNIPIYVEQISRRFTLLLAVAVLYLQSVSTSGEEELWEWKLFTNVLTPVCEIRGSRELDSLENKQTHSRKRLNFYNFPPKYICSY